MVAPSLDLTKVKLPDVDVSGTLESIKRIDVSKVKVPDVSTIDVSKASAQLGDAAKKTSEDASKAISKAAADAGPAIGAFTTDVAVPALKYGADETSKAASAAAWLGRVLSAGGGHETGDTPSNSGSDNEAGGEVPAPAAPHTSKLWLCPSSSACVRRAPTRS